MIQSITSAGEHRADALNRDCHCISVNRAALRDSLQAHLSAAGLPESFLAVPSNLFADSPVFLWQGHIDLMEEVIRAVETVTRNRQYRNAALARAPAGARQDFPTRGVFFGFDFHLGADGPRLIEINSNAGGALLNFYLAAAQKACCDEVISFFGGRTNFAAIESVLISMFRDEWRLQRPHDELRTVAIVDNDPGKQFLYPEFLLFQSLFERHGIRAIIADPQAFTLEKGALSANGQAVDLVYNRLTDFYLESPESTCLAKAYQQGAAVFTPAPYHYALYADKRNLAALSDRQQLSSFGVDETTANTLARFVPATALVTNDNADQLWADRKQLFFKPVSSYGSRGAYRGAKLTRRVWQTILDADYVAQAIVPPSERHLVVDGEAMSLKLDIRCVTYNGKIQQLSARLYQGQTTNFRSKGGGLATVFATTDDACC